MLVNVGWRVAAHTHYTGFEAVVRPTEDSSRDIQCEQCPPGRFSTDDFRGTGCVSCDAGWSAWPAGSGAVTCILNSTTSVAPATDTTLRPEATAKTSAPTTSSPSSTFVTGATTLSPLTAPQVTCDAGEHIALENWGDQSPGFSLSFDAGFFFGSVCQACPPGRFQPLNDVADVYECTAWTDPRPCSSSSSVQLGTDVSDASCTQCSAGRFSTSVESFDDDSLVAMQGAGWDTSVSSR